jgi:hypothetical protein
MKKMITVVAIFTLLLSACSMNNQTQQNTTSAGTAESTGSAGNPETTAGTETNSTTSVQPASSPSPEAAATVSDYFPYTADSHLIYKGTGNEYASYETYVDYIRNDRMQIRKNNGGSETVSVYAIKDGKLVNTFTRGETYYKYDFTSMSDGDDVLLEEPLAVGTAWTAKDGSPRSITSVDSRMETPAGKFTAIEVTTKRKDSMDKDYYVKGVGLVKSVFNSGDASMTVTSELEKIEKDVSYIRVMNFYFPQFEKDRIVYLERDVEIKTNEDMKFKFQKELKIIPDKSGLAKTFTKNTTILGIKVDEVKGTVTVDLSSDFIKEMNAGTSFEGMLLNSITSTFSDYYLKSKVIIIIEGKPYESGHILMKQGEAFNVKTDGIVKYQ